MREGAHDVDEVGRELRHTGLMAAAGALDEQRHRFFLWAPVALGAGIAAYFALPTEPGLFACAAPFLVALVVLVALPRGSLPAALATFFVLMGCGVLSAKVRVEAVRAPVLSKRLNNVAVIGVVERIEPRQERGARLTILVETLGELTDEARPRRVRVRIMSSKAMPAVGDLVSFKATLAPPAAPALPGGFDFARSAWFEGIGGVGYAYSAVMVLYPQAASSTWTGRLNAAIDAVRSTINARIAAVLPDENGAVARALITGERGGISKQTNDAFRDSGLFHILSISGLHMVVMAGAVFWVVRLLLATIQGVALRFEIKKWAAAAGICGALAYLAISGGAFATVRSAIMIVIMFLAILFDRPALALRNVALAAFVILAVYPESLFDAGFQMSFAAVTGLVAAYEEVRRRFEHRGEPHPVLRVFLFFGGIVFSTLIASAAVAPFSAYHFHQSQQYAVIANLIAIPVCNFLVMPAALAALIVMPLGLEPLPLGLMALGIDAISWCAAQVARIPGAVGHIPAMPTIAFALMISGGLWVALWQARWRLLGAALVILGIAAAPMLDRPDLFVARGGTLVAVRGKDGALSALPARQSKYELERWLEYDGDARKPEEASKAAAFACDGVGCTTRVNGAQLAVSRHAASIRDDCEAGEIVVLPVPRPRGGCQAPFVIDFFDVWREGTHAIYVSRESADEKRRVRIETVAAARGDRPWSPLVAKVTPRGGRDAGTTDRRRKDAKPEPSQREAAATPPNFTPRRDLHAPRLPPRPEIEDGEDGELAEQEFFDELHGNGNGNGNENAPERAAPQ